MFLGLISYSLYLRHWPIISFAKIQMSGDSFSTVLKLQIAMVSVVVAWLSYRFIEQAVWPKRLIRPAYAAGLMGVGGVLDVPNLGFDPKSCKTLRPVLGDAKRQSACHKSRQNIDQQFVSSRQAHIIEVLRELPEVLVVNAADAVCDQSRCYGMKDGALLYSDSNHLSVAGSMLVGRLIAERMRSAKFIGHRPP